MSAADDIRFVVPVQRTLDVDGCAVVLGPLCMEQIFELLDVVDPLRESIRQRLLALPEEARAVFSTGQIEGEDERRALTDLLLALVREHREAACKVVAICSEMEVEHVRRLLPDRFIALLLVSIEVNLDFFSKALPVLASLVAPLARALKSPA